MLSSKKFNEGELVFLPSGVSLIKYRDPGPVENNPMISEWVRVPDPCHVLVINNCNKYDAPYVRVFYEGTSWLARPADLYPTRRNEIG